jgi:hypothetical protein
VVHAYGASGVFCCQSFHCAILHATAWLIGLIISSTDAIFVLGKCSVGAQQSCTCHLEASEVHICHCTSSRILQTFNWSSTRMLQQRK